MEVVKHIEEIGENRYRLTLVDRHWLWGERSKRFIEVDTLHIESVLEYAENNPRYFTVKTSVEAGREA